MLQIYHYTRMYHRELVDSEGGEVSAEDAVVVVFAGRSNSLAARCLASLDLRTL